MDPTAMKSGLLGCIPSPQTAKPAEAPGRGYLQNEMEQLSSCSTMNVYKLRQDELHLVRFSFASVGVINAVLYRK